MHMAMHGAPTLRWGFWYLSELAVIIAALGISGLLVTWSRLSQRQRVLLTTALALTVFILSSSVQAMSMSNYSAHMVEHLIVVLVIAPVVAGAVSHPLRRPLAVIGFAALTVLVPLFHLTSLGEWVMKYRDGHLFELAAFFLVGVWFWAPVYGSQRVMGDQQRITYTVLALPVIATTGLVLWSATPASLRDVGMSMSNITILDVRQGGVVMMAMGTALMLMHLIALGVTAAAHQRAIHEPVGLRYA
jgi:cytochrome c oxidase assembly factor CtaG